MTDGIEEEVEVLNQVIDKINSLRRSTLGKDELAVELLHSASTIINALRRYRLYLDYSRRSDKEYIEDLIQTTIDALRRFLRGFKKK